MRAGRNALLITLAISLPGCPDKSARPPPPARDGKLGKQRCSSLPGASNRRLKAFQRPYDGAFAVINLFDHKTPGDYRAFDPGASVLTYCGLEMLGAFDGHEGYLWSVPLGTPIFPVADGEVIAAGIEPEFFCPQTRELVRDQQVVEVGHPGVGGGYVTTYRHLSQVLVKEGDKVVGTQRLGLSGQSGCATEPVLYFSVKRLGGTKTGKPTWVDPYGWDGPGDDPWAGDKEGATSLYLWKDGEAPALAPR